MSGRSVAIWLWQIMQVFTLGMPAIGPFSTLSWQSVHTAFLAMCVLCGKGIGCSGRGRMLKNSRAASAAVRCAVVNTDDDTDEGCVPHAATAIAHTRIDARLKPRATTVGRAFRRAVHARRIYLPWRLRR